MKNFACKNRVLQRDRLLERRALEREYCNCMSYEYMLKVKVTDRPGGEFYTSHRLFDVLHYSVTMFKSYCKILVAINHFLQKRNQKRVLNFGKIEDKKILIQLYCYDIIVNYYNIVVENLNSTLYILDQSTIHFKKQYMQA
jgi:hypothetical protein